VSELNCGNCGSPMDYNVCPECYEQELYDLRIQLAELERKNHDLLRENGVLEEAIHKI